MQSIIHELSSCNTKVFTNIQELQYIRAGNIQGLTYTRDKK